MEAVLTAGNQRDEREDTVLSEAFQRATGGRISTPNTLQQAMFPRLLSGDRGLVVPSGPGAGRLESVFVPSQTTCQDVHWKQRLFIIASDYGLLDDYEHRLVPYMRALAASDGIPRTIHISQSDASMCACYSPDGSVIRRDYDHPLDSDVDLAVMRLSDFQTQFFGTGGLQSLPQPLAPDESNGLLFNGRTILYFDEAQAYAPDEFGSFVRLVKFLFAQDLDVIVGSSTLPAAAMDELSFLEVLYVPEANEEPARTLQYAEVHGWSSPAVGRALAGASRSLLVGSLPADLERIACVAMAAGNDPIVYSSALPQAQRRQLYAGLRDAQEQGIGFCCVADAAAVETSDLSAEVLITDICSPDALLRRAGRCNRRREFAQGRILVIGPTKDSADRGENAELGSHYLNLLQELADPATFTGAEWIPLIA